MAKGLELRPATEFIFVSAQELRPKNAGDAENIEERFVVVATTRMFGAVDQARGVDGVAPVAKVLTVFDTLSNVLGGIDFDLDKEEGVLVFEDEVNTRHADLAD